MEFDTRGDILYSPGDWRINTNKLNWKDSDTYNLPILEIIDGDGRHVATLPYNPQFCSIEERVRSMANACLFRMSPIMLKVLSGMAVSHRHQFPPPSDIRECKYWHGLDILLKVAKGDDFHRDREADSRCIKCLQFPTDRRCPLAEDGKPGQCYAHLKNWRRLEEGCPMLKGKKAKKKSAKKDSREEANEQDA